MATDTYTSMRYILLLKHIVYKINKCLILYYIHFLGTLKLIFNANIIYVLIMDNTHIEKLYAVIQTPGNVNAHTRTYRRAIYLTRQ